MRNECDKYRLGIPATRILVGIPLTVVLTGVLFALMGCRGEERPAPAVSTYQTYVDPGQTFSVDLLANLEVEKLSPPDGRGYGALGNQIGFSIGVYETGFRDVREHIPRGTSRSEFAEYYIEGCLADAGSTVSSKETVHRASGTVTRAVGQSGDMHIVVEIYLKDDRMFVLIVQTDAPNGLKRDSVQRFFESFRCL